MEELFRQIRKENMMYSRQVKILIIILFTLFVVESSAQFQNDYANVTLRIPSIALIDIEPEGNNSVALQVSPAVESGLEPQIQETSPQTLWINYSSALPFSQNSRSIAAEIASGSLPDGVSLGIEASAFSGIGLGKHGYSQGFVQLGQMPRTVIYDIGNSFTGNGVNNGHSLTFTLGVDDFSKITAVGVTQLTILYTISDN